MRRLKNAETQNRTADTAVFSRMLYQLSYLGVGSMLQCVRKLCKVFGRIEFYADSNGCQKSSG